MNQNGKNLGWKGFLPALLIYLLIAIFSQYLTIGALLAPIFLPTLLLIGYYTFGPLPFLILYAAPVILSFFLPGNGLFFILMIPISFLVLALEKVRRYKQEGNRAIFWTSLASFWGILASVVVHIYIVAKTNLQGFIQSVVQLSKSQMFNEDQVALWGPEYQEILKEMSESISVPLVTSTLIVVLVFFSLLLGYLNLRVAKDRLPGFASHVPDFSKLRFPPAIFLPLALLALLGNYLRLQGHTLGEPLFISGITLMSFFGVIGGLSLLDYYLRKTLGPQRKFFRRLLLILTFLILNADILLGIAIIDAIFDFRNLSGKSLAKWLSWKIKNSLGGEDRG